MKKILLIALTLLPVMLMAQDPNGELDQLSDFSKMETRYFTMDDGTQLATDVYLPITTDSMTIEVDLPGTGPATILVIPKGTQYLIYDSINNAVNSNPYQLPVIFTRSPYNKGSYVSYGGIVSFMGFAFVAQDMRGCYESEGAYMPMYSDSWEKNEYHPDIKHLLDITEFDDPRNSNKHEDGYQSIRYLTDSLKRQMDYNMDEVVDTFLLCNGSIGMFGASALGNSQYTAAATHKIDPNQPGLKSLMPVVATADQHWVTLTQNGVFRHSIVNNWITGQISTINDASLNGSDPTIDNDIHSFTDYNLSNSNEAIDWCLKLMVDSPINGNLPGYYPNSPIRSAMDVTYAPVDANGDADGDGTHSRFSNMDVPAYHLTGWWDIFIDGQINTFNQMQANISNENGNRELQKLIIGPWAHQTVTSQTTGHITYPENVDDVVMIDLNELEDSESFQGNVFSSEVYKWYRHTLNERQGLKEPKFIIPAATEWQEINSVYSVRIPSHDYIIPYSDFIAYIGGLQGLEGLKFQLNVAGSISNQVYDLPIIEEPLLDISAAPESSTGDYFQNTENVRFYVVGPVDDGVMENDNVGNYWYKTDSFPFVNNIDYTNFYLHSDMSMNEEIPTLDEGSLSYTHDPDNPVATVGGANMTLVLPNSEQRNQGQINLADPSLIASTMNHPGVIGFTSDVIMDSLSIIGFPKMSLYAASTVQPSGSVPTDTDFFVRILDVYPSGEEYFVVEGAVNARAREYARSIYQGNPNPDAEFSNIMSDEYYHYEFDLMPIAYTFGKDHRVKILISSGNYPRYMSSANIPLNDGEFFRRMPNDGQTYTFNGNETSPRVATNEVTFAPNMPTHISLPIYGDYHTDNNNLSVVDDNDIEIFPNPVHDKLFVRLNGSYMSEIKIYNLYGQLMYANKSIGLTELDMGTYTSGTYIIRISNQYETTSQKIVID